MGFLKANARGKQREDRLRVAVVTGTRAEFGLLEPVLRAMRRHRRLEPRLIVTGMHLLSKFGRTIDQIREAGWDVDAVVRMQSGRGVREEPEALAKGISGIAKAFDRLDCPVVLVLGDRIEALAGACAAAVGRRILVHIHGGDRAVLVVTHNREIARAADRVVELSSGRIVSDGPPPGGRAEIAELQW